METRAKHNRNLLSASLIFPLTLSLSLPIAANMLSLFLLPQAEGFCHRDLLDHGAEIS